MMRQRFFGLALGALAGCPISSNHAIAQSDACAEGYVWREAFYGDHVCVSENTHDRAQSDNKNAAELRAGKYGDQCVQGLVWRLSMLRRYVYPMTDPVRIIRHEAVPGAGFH